MKRLELALEEMASPLEFLLKVRDESDVQFAELP